jgi:hypothetical protein
MHSRVDVGFDKPSSTQTVWTEYCNSLPADLQGMLRNSRQTSLLRNRYYDSFWIYFFQGARSSDPRVIEDIMTRVVPRLAKHLDLRSDVVAVVLLTSIRRAVNPAMVPHLVTLLSNQLDNRTSLLVREDILLGCMQCLVAPLSLRLALPNLAPSIFLGLRTLDAVSRTSLSEISLTSDEIDYNCVVASRTARQFISAVQQWSHVKWAVSHIATVLHLLVSISKSLGIIIFDVGNTKHL